MSPLPSTFSSPSSSPSTFGAQLLLALALLLISLPSPAREQPEPVAIDAGFRPAEQAAQLLSLSEAQTLKGLKRVAVSQFSVEFVTGDSVSAETSGFAAAGRARVTAFHRLVGVGQAEFQALSEAMHGEFLRQLQASGLEVVPHEQLLAAPSYRKLAAAGLAMPDIQEDAITVAPAGMALFGANRLAAQTTQPSGMFSGLQAFGSAMSAIGNVSDLQSLQVELGDATLLEVHLRVHFVQLVNQNKGFFGRLASQASVSAQTAPSIRSARMGVQVGAYNAQLALKQALTLDASAFSEVREQASSKADVAGAVLAGLINLASGSQNRSDSKRFETVAEPSRYREVLSTGLSQTQAMLVARLQAER